MENIKSAETLNPIALDRALKLKKNFKAIPYPIQKVYSAIFGQIIILNIQCEKISSSLYTVNMLEEDT